MSKGFKGQFTRHNFPSSTTDREQSGGNLVKLNWDTYQSQAQTLLAHI